MAAGCGRLDMPFLFILATDALHKKTSGRCEFWWCTDPQSFYFLTLCMHGKLKLVFACMYKAALYIWPVQRQ
jgi:hypothetical protein